MTHADDPRKLSRTTHGTAACGLVLTVEFLNRTLYDYDRPTSCMTHADDSRKLSGPLMAQQAGWCLHSMEDAALSNHTKMKCEAKATV
eukprot:scaffold32756_cov44-Attheya_sp.AAC.3